MSMMSVLAAAEPKVDSAEPQSGLEFEAKLAAFEARIQRGDKIEPHDWMPLDYRKQLIRMISQHAHSEIVGCLPEGGWIPNAPTFRRKLALTAKVQDEAGHGQLLYRAAETLGISREQMIDDLLSGKAKYSQLRPAAPGHAHAARRRAGARRREVGRDQVAARRTLHVKAPAKAHMTLRPSLRVAPEMTRRLTR